MDLFADTMPTTVDPATGREIPDIPDDSAGLDLVFGII